MDGSLHAIYQLIKMINRQLMRGFRNFKGVINSRQKRGVVINVRWAGTHSLSLVLEPMADWRK